jgi:hypothetical protein
MGPGLVRDAPEVRTDRLSQQSEEQRLETPDSFQPWLSAIVGRPSTIASGNSYVT